MNEGLIRGFYAAFVAGDRDAVDAMLAEDFTFSSPDDPQLDKAGFFERCFPHHKLVGTLRVEWIEERGDQVIVRYETTKPSGERATNLELLRLEGDRIREALVYYGPDQTS